jgi:hypothetical protein
MKKILIIIIAFNFWITNAFSQALMNEDFESYDQGPIANQNPGWSDFTMATADVKWDGGDFTACTEQDNNRAYLSYTSGDNVESRVVVSSATQMQLDLHVVNETGFHIRFNQDNENIFEYINSINIQEISYKFIIDFYNLKAEVYINDTLVQTSSIENNYTNLTSIDFSNSFGKFKLGCIYLTDITDIDNDGYTIYSDCDDNNPDVHPGATEIVYNGIDDDCNPATLDNDLDQDGFNSPADCDDNNPDVHPGATEIVYNGIDDDCNPANLDNDLDQDGFNSPEDCDDNNPNVHPGATEIVYNGIDDDCNPATLDNDLDQDGFNSPEDCDDNNPNVHPGATEIVYNGIDDDCNPATLDNDLDQDGFNSPEDCDDNNPDVHPGATEIVYNGIDDDCNPATLDNDLDQDGFNIPEDCDDNNPDVHPGATEIAYNGVDDDCNPATLENDLDQDGFKSPEDCDDNNPDVNPGATEIAYNGVDDDCNPATLENDLDQDGFKSPEDCDDNNPDVNPGAQEIPNNGIDDNCDGSVDETAHIKSIKHGIKILPNPCINILSIEAEEPIENVSVFDFQGKEMLIEYRSKTIPVNQLPSGIYVIRIKYTNGENSVATF